jgi:hypothetical protein
MAIRGAAFGSPIDDLLEEYMRGGKLQAGIQRTSAVSLRRSPICNIALQYPYRSKDDEYCKRMFQVGDG